MGTPTLLSALKPVMTRRQNRGALFEGDVFCILFSDDRVLRSFEFAPGDGALNLHPHLDYPTGATYAERFLALYDQLRAEPASRRLVPFDVKSVVSFAAGEQICISRDDQQHQVAFYLIVCAADPSHIALVPNVPSATLSTVREGDANAPNNPTIADKDGAVNASRKLPLEGSAYGFLDPCLAAYRMPIGLLHTALRRVRRCAAFGQRSGEHYVNPWTGVSFLKWKPVTVDSMGPLLPTEAGHLTAFCGVLRLWRGLRSAPNLPIRFDMVGLQPRLADMKLILREKRQVLVQYKIDGKERAVGNLDKVAIARGVGPLRKYYFSSHDRFDFLLYEFEFPDRPHYAKKLVFFFLPEWRLPREFYDELPPGQLESTFRRPEFEPYRVEWDNAGLWVWRMARIIEENPMPRGPARQRRSSDLQSATSRMVLDSLRLLRTPLPASGSRPPWNQAVWLDVHTACHRRLFRAVMEQCARRSSGLLLALADEHPNGDFAYCAYRWTPQERRAYASTFRPPRTIHELPAATPVVTLYAMARTTECNFRGPKLSSPEFRRVNSCRAPRLLVFDAVIPEDPGVCGPLFVVPTDDVGPTRAHIDRHRENLKVDKHNGGFEARTPSMWQLLHSGRAVTDYVVSAGGPMVYDGGDRWAGLWELLERFLGVASFEHPRYAHRDPAQYHCSVRQLHQRIVEELSRE